MPSLPFLLITFQIAIIEQTASQKQQQFVFKMALLNEKTQGDDVLTLIPQPSFVIKTKIEQQNGKRKALTKVFINVCSNPQVPLPPTTYTDNKDKNEEFSPEIVYPLIMNNKWEIPIITSDEREDTDKKGALLYVYDCFINDKCMTWIHVYTDLKDILVEWCLESVELRFGISLDRDAIKFPKMTYKGIDKKLVNLQVLKTDLDSRNFQKQKQELERIVKNEEHLLVVDAVKGKSEKLGIDQDDSIEDESSSTVTIFPRDRDITNNGKPLIQEIKTTTVPSVPDTTMKNFSSLYLEHGNNSQLAKKQKQSKREFEKQTKKLIKFDMSFHSLNVENNDTNKERFQLLIKLIPNLVDVSDFEIMFDSKKQSLLLKCMDDNIQVATNDSSFFEIPVPTYLLRHDKQLQYKSFYVMLEKSLNIFM